MGLRRIGSLKQEVRLRKDVYTIRMVPLRYLTVQDIVPYRNILSPLQIAADLPASDYG